MAEKNERAIKVVAENRKARFNYAIEDTVEAGIALTGTEVKSIRNGKTTIAESYADTKGGEIWLINANIPEYLQANRFNHEPKRPRKLLLHRKQINKLMGAVDRDGMTLIPLKLYFNERGRAKLLLAVAKGKKLHDKRESEKKRDWGREKGRLLLAPGAGIAAPMSIRHCERSEAIHRAANEKRIASSRSLSSGAHSRDPLAPRNDDRWRIVRCTREICLKSTGA